jgi:saccharopine dehydrogenase-like NADP-dependent oxidoreductase
MEAMVKDTIGFFGLGAVGSVLLTCLAELSERDGVPKRFVVFVRNPEVSQDALFHAEHFFDRIEFVGVPDFEELWATNTPHAARLGRCEVLINAALPDFNGKIIECALRHGAHCVDLASAMYDEKTQRTLTFAQYDHDEALRAAGLAAIINQGISPGVTNYLIAERLQELLVGDRRDLTIESIDLFLLEDIDSDEIVFSWSPVVALEELAQKPRVLEGGRLVVQQPFADPESYTFPHEDRATREYPLYQEELLSLHRAFPEVGSIRVFTGGSEVELVKSLFKMNLLSKVSITENPDLTVESLVRKILPGMKKPRRIEEYLRTGIIRRAHFAAAAEIRVREQLRNRSRALVETVGLSYHRYRAMLDTPYAGATYISYPTGVGAAILMWHALAHARAGEGELRGVLSSEDLARSFPRARLDAVRRDFVAWGLDLFQSVHGAGDD